MAATVEGHEAEVAFYADGEAGGQLITKVGLNAGIDAVSTGEAEGVAFVEEFLTADAAAVALGLYLSCHTEGYIGAGREDDVARLGKAVVIVEEERDFYIVGRGGTAHEAVDLLARLVEHGVAVIVNAGHGLVGRAPAFAVEHEAGREGPMLVELVFVGHTDFVGSHHTVVDALAGKTAANFQLPFLGMDCSRSCQAEQGKEHEKHSFHRDFIFSNGK